MPIGIPINNETKILVANYYKSKPMTIKECAKKNNLSSPTVIKILDEMSIERYKKAKIYNPNLKEDYFANIDSEYKAYFLGFIIADGNVFVKNDKSNRQASISICQKKEDSYILKEFLKDIGSNTSLGND